MCGLRPVESCDPLRNRLEMQVESRDYHIPLGCNMLTRLPSVSINDA